MSTQRGPDDPSLLRLADGILIPPFPGTTAPRWLLTALEGGLAGVTLFSGNVADSDQLAELTERLRSVTAEPLIAIDEEGGDVTRIAHRTGSPYPGNAALGAADDPELTRRVYRDIGADLAAAGVNVDLAPSVDVNTALDNPVIGTRAFGAEAELVSRHAAAAIAGLHAVGVAACAKHFPGHGSTREDSHDVLATVPGGLDVLWLRDLPPFKPAIAAGVKGVMTGHLRVPELTGELPATLSHAALTGLLRNQLGFGGVIVTDALEMRGIQDARGYRGMPECAVLAVAAGADLLCLGRDQDEQTYLAVRAALARAAANGVLPGDRLEEAAARVGELRGWLAAEAYDAGHEEHGHTRVPDHLARGGRHDRGIGSFCLTFDQPIGWEKFAAIMMELIAAHGAEILRVKGLLNVTGRSEPLVIHGVQHLFHPPVLLPKWPSEDRRTRMVFITRDLPRETIEETFAAFAEADA